MECAMFRRLETYGVPGAVGDRLLFWDFRAEPDPDAEVVPGDPVPLRWTLSLQVWASGRWRRPEQAAWLAECGHPVPVSKQALALSQAQLEALTCALAPVAVVSWEAMNARDAALAALRVGEGAKALEAAERLANVAPDWVDTRLLKLEVLLGQVRDADAAQAVYDDLPEGVLDDVAARRVRQSIALLREDWDGYAAELAGVLEGGERPWWNFEILGLAYWAGGRLDDALSTFEHGMAEHDNRRDLVLRRAELLAAMDRGVDALEALDGVVSQSNPPPKAWALRGWLRRDTDPEQAAQDYNLALAADPDEAVARVGRGLQRWTAGDLEGARGDLEPYRYSGWEDAWQAWVAFSTETGLETGPHPAELAHAHDHDHDHDACGD